MILNRGLSAFLKRMGLSSLLPSSISGTGYSEETSSIDPSSQTAIPELFGPDGLSLRMSRRSLMKLLLTSAAVATTVDIEQLLWVPKPIIVVPPLGANPNMGQIVAEAWELYVMSNPLPFERNWMRDAFGAHSHYVKKVSW